MKQLNYFAAALLGLIHTLGRSVCAPSRRWCLALFALAVSLLLAGNAFGSQPAPQPLNPPPPPFYTCMATGSGTVCHGKTTDTHFAGFDGSCPQGFDILENGYANVEATRYYDINGNLIRRVQHQHFPASNPLNVLYNSQTGKSVPYSADLTQTDDLAVPGDFNSATTTLTGKLYMATLPGGGLLVHDVGVFVFAPDGSVQTDHGPKLLFYGQNDALCAALS